VQRQVNESLAVGGISERITGEKSPLHSKCPNRDSECNRLDSNSHVGTG
jgi:hypothetical protein